MSFNGTGIFQINTPGQPVVAGTTITSTAFNALTTDLATGLTNCLTKDGQSTPTANIKMGSYKLTGLGVATTAGDALSFGNTATISTLTLTNALTVANGGTGLTTLTAKAVMIGNGTAAPTFVVGGTLGNVLTFDGTDWISSAPASSGLAAAQTKTANYTAVAGDVLACNTITTGAFSITLPATPVAGQKPIIIFDSGTTDVVNGFATNNLTVLRNGNTINTLSDDVVFSTKGVSVIFEYIAGTWRMRIG